MSEADQQKQGILYVITCAAQSSEPMDIQDFMKLARASLWDVYIIATPQGTKFIEIPLLEKLTGHPIRSEYRHPAEPDSMPKPNAIIVVPATFNTINKWAQGITDTLALGILCEHTGLGTPIITIPCVPPESLARHPAFTKSMTLLKDYGSIILYEPQKYPPMNNIPWQVVLDTLLNATVRYSLPQQKEGVY